MEKYIRGVGERFELGYCFDFAYLFIMQKFLYGTSSPKMDYIYLEPYSIFF